jgi:hypothetical protein
MLFRIIHAMFRGLRVLLRLIIPIAAALTNYHIKKYPLRRKISNGSRDLFFGHKADRCVKLTTNLQLVPRSRKCGSVHPLSHRLHGAVLNWISTETIVTLRTRRISRNYLVLVMFAVLQIAVRIFLVKAVSA